MLAPAIPFLILAGPSQTPPPLPVLAPPVKITAAGRPIETEIGHPDPWVFDVNNDGKKDLLLGQFGGGRLRIYLNSGTNSAPRFDRFTFLQAGGKDASVRASCCIGFNPQVLDLNGDGIMDLVSGEYSPGDVYWFQGTPTGFLPRQVLAEEKSGVAELDRMMSTVHFTDWDGDGDQDMVLGNVKGKVFLNLNAGSRTEPRFGKRVELMAGGAPMGTGLEKTDPFVTDWDGDGVRDLLVGDEWAHVWFFRGKPGGTFERGQPLIPGRAKLVPGYRLRIHVTDWNEDGKPDLLVGSCEEVGGRTTGFLYLFLRE